MTAQLIDGKAIAQKVRDEVKEKVAQRIADGKSQPGLATVLVGERIDSATYVKMKQKACAELGMTSFHHPIPADIKQEDLEKLITELNANPKVNGILVQLPLPDHLDEERILQLISIEKDVDGFSPILWHFRCHNKRQSRLFRLIPMSYPHKTLAMPDIVAF